MFECVLHLGFWRHHLSHLQMKGVKPLQGMVNDMDLKKVTHDGPISFTNFKICIERKKHRLSFVKDGAIDVSYYKNCAFSHLWDNENDLCEKNLLFHHFIDDMSHNIWLYFVITKG